MIMMIIIMKMEMMTMMSRDYDDVDNDIVEEKKNSGDNDT